jgi:hypothetical protein
MEGPALQPVLRPYGTESDQVAEQANVGLVFVPLKLAWRPKVVLPPPAMTPLDVTFVAVTAVPLEVTVAFHELVMAWLPPQVQVTFQLLVATVPELVTVTVAVKPLDQVLSTIAAVHLAADEAVPEGAGVADVLGRTVAVAEATGVTLGRTVAVAEATGVTLGRTVAVALGVGVREADDIGVGVGVGPLESGNLIDVR